MILKRTRIDFIDLCRILAVSSVLLGHKFYDDLKTIGSISANHIIFRDLANILDSFCYGGGFGVVLFFCVSGYIIRYVLERESWQEFLIKRIFRIFPLYWSAVLICYFITPENLRSDLKTLFIQLTLLGDFFNTPQSLGWVEWTLRIEILFYIFLGVAKAAGLLDFKSIWLVLSLLFINFLLYIFPPWPANQSWSEGYVSIYSPFLFIGVYFREFEKRNISKLFLFFLICATLFMHCYLIQNHHSNWINARFSLLGVLVFLMLFWGRSKIELPSWAFLFSELTYSLYLFHNWLFDYFTKTFLKIYFHKLFAIFLLLIFCYLANRLIEKPGIVIGRKIYNRLFKA